MDPPSPLFVRQRSAARSRRTARPSPRCRHGRRRRASVRRRRSALDVGLHRSRIAPARRRRGFARSARVRQLVRSDRVPRNQTAPCAPPPTGPGGGHQGLEGVRRLPEAAAASRCVPMAESRRTSAWCPPPDRSGSVAVRFDRRCADRNIAALPNRPNRARPRQLRSGAIDTARAPTSNTTGTAAPKRGGADQRYGIEMTTLPFFGILPHEPIGFTLAMFEYARSTVHWSIMLPCVPWTMQA